MEVTRRRPRKLRACKYGDRIPATQKCPRKPYPCKYGQRIAETGKCPKKPRPQSQQTQTQRRRSQPRPSRRPQKSPTKVVSRFMRNTTGKRQAEFLKNVCSDSGQCIMFGVELSKINEFFRFGTFQYAVPPVKQIGLPSNNGFIKEINYSRFGYTAQAILKSTVSNEADNLFYEFFVGLHINQWAKFFPCFVETYDLFNYTDDAAYDYVKNTPRIDNMRLFKDLLNDVMTDKQGSQFNMRDFNFPAFCRDAKHLAILIQNVKGAVSLYDAAGLYGTVNSYELYAILLQVYFPLAVLTDEFVHNDLHPGNILLYSPAPQKYIRFHYYFADGSQIQFNSYYIAKVIDYGRCFTADSEALYRLICATRECDPNCGYNYGFRFMEPKLEASSWFVSSTKRNPSHDLRVFYNYYPELVKYGVGVEDKALKKYGTKPNVKSGLGLKRQKIHNVNDAAEFLKGYVFLNSAIYLDDAAAFPPNARFGDLHVYLDRSRPMHFEKA